MALAGGRALIAVRAIGDAQLVVGLPLEMRGDLHKIAQAFFAKPQGLGLAPALGHVGEDDEESTARLRTAANLQGPSVGAQPLIAEGLFGGVRQQAFDFLIVGFAAVFAALVEEVGQFS